MIWKALIATILIEGIVTILVTRSWKWVWYNFLCNIVTNPLLNLSISFFVNKIYGSWIYVFIIGEAVVLFSEMWLLKLMSGETYKKCFFISLITNLVSCVAGLIFDAF